MRSLVTMAFACGCLLSAGSMAHAQDAPVLPSAPVVLPAAPSPELMELSPEQQKELTHWLDDMAKWQRQEKRWPNEPAHNNYGKIVTRTLQPAPPDWLPASCASLAGSVAVKPPEALDKGCRVLQGLSADPEAEAIRQQTLAVRVDKEKVKKSSFFSRVHLDGLWSTTSSDVRYYGLVGSHISLVDVGRVQFFGPPGILVLRMPDGLRSHQIRVGYTWGLSVRLADLRLFTPQKNMTLFLSIAKCWTVGNASDRLTPGGFDIAGFSIAPRKNRE